MTLVRTVLFRSAMLGTYIVSYFLNHNATTEECWENRMGQEIYRLFIYDLVIVGIACIVVVWLSCVTWLCMAGLDYGLERGRDVDCRIA
jgi:hypothetical protein